VTQTRDMWMDHFYISGRPEQEAKPGSKPGANGCIGRSMERLLRRRHATASGGTSRRLVRRDPTIGPHVAPFGWAMRILLTDGNERATLATARSLVRAGHAVWVTAPMRLS